MNQKSSTETLSQVLLTILYVGWIIMILPAGGILSILFIASGDAFWVMVGLAGAVFTVTLVALPALIWGR